MKIYYSPYFNGHSYVDYTKHGGLLGEALESTEGLLSRIELMCGMAYPDYDIEEKRTEEYYDALTATVHKGLAECPSLLNDSKKDEQTETFEQLNVTTELLRWRDTLILAGWDKKTELNGKLNLIYQAERNIPSDSIITHGSADRWLNLYNSKKPSGLKERMQIEVMCPKVLVPQLVQDVIAMISSDDCYKLENIGGVIPDDCRVIKFNERYEAYEWLACQQPHSNQVVACADSERLDYVMRCCDKPVTSAEANIGCHHVVTDVRSMLDVPDSLIWIDCNGGYAFRYPYDFISDGETELSIPTEQEMILAVHKHYVNVLNSITNVTLVSSTYDTSDALTENPMVASMLHKKESAVKAEDNVVTGIADKNEKNEEIHFTPEPSYNLNKKVDVGDSRMSYSALDTLITFPFNHIVERELNLYEPFHNEDVRTMKGKVAHKVVEMMVGDFGRIETSKYDEYLGRALKNDEMIDKSIKKCILELPENKFELEDLQLTLKDSLITLARIISDNNLEIVGSEVAIPANANEDKSEFVDTEKFGKSIAFIDLVLKKIGKEEYYIFDFKYSWSSHYADILKDNKSIQFAVYKYLFTKFYAGGGKQLKGLGYYLFPKNTLYVPDNADKGDLHGDNVQPIAVDTSKIADTLTAVKAAYDYRKEQFKQGIIEEGEGMPLSEINYPDSDLFPLAADGNKKSGPYTPNHIVLKNQIR